MKKGKCHSTAGDSTTAAIGSDGPVRANESKAPILVDFSGFAEVVAERVIQRMTECGRGTALMEGSEGFGRTMLRSEIDPMRVYSVKEVARLLAIGQNSVYDIPRDRLPLVPRPGRNGYRGINVLLYSMGLDPIDDEAIGRSLREEFLARHKTPPAVRAVGGGKVVTRVI